jgi:hypothetical protein
MVGDLKTVNWAKNGPTRFLSARLKVGFLTIVIPTAVSLMRQ